MKGTFFLYHPLLFCLSLCKKAVGGPLGNSPGLRNQQENLRRPRAARYAVGLFIRNAGGPCKALLIVKLEREEGDIVICMLDFGSLHVEDFKNVFLYMIYYVYIYVYTYVFMYVCVFV
jgi:hypothetical protein